MIRIIEIESITSFGYRMNQFCHLPSYYMGRVWPYIITGLSELQNVRKDYDH